MSYCLPVAATSVIDLRAAGHRGLGRHRRLSINHDDLADDGPQTRSSHGLFRPPLARARVPRRPRPAMSAVAHPRISNEIGEDDDVGLVTSCPPIKRPTTGDDT